MILTKDELAARELKKASRLARLMFTPKRFYKPKSATFVQYVAPLKPGNAKECFNGGKCVDCKRPKSIGAGMRCRECYSIMARDDYEAKVSADNRRVRKNEKAFQTVTKEIAMSKKTVPATPITRSTSGLRNTLFEEMEALRNGTSNAQRARSVAMMANSILQSVQVEIEYHKYVNANKGRSQGDDKVVALGTDISLVA